MQDYFRKLYTSDPLFHALVIARLRKLEELEGTSGLSLSDIGTDDELDILREYCVTLYNEYRTLRTAFLENMQLTGRCVRFKHSTN
jgi:hypothetical protein